MIALPVKTSEWRGSSAELCRQQGWGPGTVLVSDPLPKSIDDTARRILLTAVGATHVLAIQQWDDDEGSELCWELTCADWRAEST